MARAELATKHNTKFDEAIAAYGLAGAELLMASILDSVSHANEVLPIVEPIRNVYVAVEDLPEDYEGSSGRFIIIAGRIELVLDRNTDPVAICNKLPASIAHEASHKVHFQHIQGTGLRWPRTWFARAVGEGIAELGTAFQQIDFYDPGTALYIPQEKHNKYVAVFEELLAKERWHAQDGEMAYDAFMQEPDEDQRSKGYAAAHYVVEAFTGRYDYDLQTVMRTPIEEFEEFYEAIR